MPDSTRGRGTEAIKPAASAPSGRTPPTVSCRIPRPRYSGHPRAGAHVVEGREEDVVLLRRADGDPDALAGEQAGDHRACLPRGGELGGLLPRRQPDEVGLAVGDVEAAPAQGGGEPVAL